MNRNSVFDKPAVDEIIGKGVMSFPK
jgi:hypothetical protein